MAEAEKASIFPSIQETQYKQATHVGIDHWMLQLVSNFVPILNQDPTTTAMLLRYCHT